jgi:hypothetical protein
MVCGDIMYLTLPRGTAKASYGGLRRGKGVESHPGMNVKTWGAAVPSGSWVRT